MKKVLLCLILSLLLNLPVSVWAYDYGDLKSSTLVSKAWQALNEGDLEATLAFTQKCVELYAGNAKEMQDSLSDYASRSKNEVFSYWALNDVATSLFIQGEAYRKADMKEEALKSYNQLINEFTFGQCWDSGGWFWKPAKAAEEKIALMESGEKYDFSDVSPPNLTAQSWKALKNDNLEDVLAYTNKCIELYADKARDLQNSLDMPPWESKEKIHSYGLLNDVGTCLFIKGEALKKANRIDEAKKVFELLISDFTYAQCWDPQGWFWKPAKAAQQRLDLFKDQGL